MAKEIERKFLVTSKKILKELKGGEKIVQGYLSSVPQRVVRVRVKGEKGFITVKGLPKSGGVERYEWEKEIDVQDALELLDLCEESLIKKTRYNIEYGAHIFEIDVFEGKLDGLVIAELELSHEDEHYQTPDWLGEEVTGLLQYYNSTLKDKNGYV